MIENTMVPISTPQSLAISLFGIVFSVLVLVFLPDISANAQVEMWAYIVAGAVPILLLRMARSMMVLRPEIADSQLSASDRRTKHRLKFLTRSVTYIYVVLIFVGAFGVAGYFPVVDNVVVMRTALEIAVLTLAVSVTLGFVYTRRFVAPNP